MRVSQPKHPGKTPKKLNNIKMPSVHKRTRTLKEEEEKKEIISSSLSSIFLEPMNTQIREKDRGGATVLR